MDLANPVRPGPPGSWRYSGSALAHWAFSGRDEAKAEIRAAVRYLFEGAAATGREVVVLEIMDIMRQVTTGLPPRQRTPLDDGMDRPEKTAPGRGVNWGRHSSDVMGGHYTRSLITK